jgi:hypothetical protein
VLVAAEKATDLTRQILAFSRKQVMTPVPVDVNGIILGMGKIIARLLGEDIEVSLNLTGAQLMEGYGLSEAPTATHCNPMFGEKRTGSIGLPSWSGGTGKPCQ